MDQHAWAQQGWALQYEQLSSGRFKGRIHRVQLPEVSLLRLMERMRDIGGIT